MKIQRRNVDRETYAACRAEGYGHTVSNILAGRTKLGEREVSGAVTPGLDKLDDWRLLPDIDKAADRIHKAMINHELICICSDYDVDGVNFSAITLEALIEYFGYKEDRIVSIIGNRFTDGYGLSQTICDRILCSETRPSLIVTGDCGSSDEARIQQLSEAGIDVIVTDHHEIPSEGIPASAFAVVSPLRDDSRYPDKGIAGCMVGWLTMCAVGEKLRQAGQHIGDLNTLLDYAGLGTVADCVTLSPRDVHNNRAAVQYGLNLMNKGSRPAWRAFKKECLNQGDKFQGSTLGWRIGPLCNSAGRLKDASAGLKFLRAKTEEEATRHLRKLINTNDERKKIQQSLSDEAIRQGEEQVKKGKMSILVRFSPGHPGVHGIVASRVVETFGRPTVCLSDAPSDDKLVTGSGRSIDDFHLRDALQACWDMEPHLFTKMGGHKAACGASLDKKNIDRLENLFEQQCNKFLTDEMVGPKVLTDGEIPVQELNLDLIQELSCLEPFGVQFDPPTFEGIFEIRDIRVVGKDKNHMQVALKDPRSHMGFGSIWFFFEQVLNGREMPKVGSRAKVVYTLSENTFRGETNLQLMIKTIERLEN